MGPVDCVGTAFDDHEASAVDQFGCTGSRSRDGENAIGVAVHDQGGDVDAGHVLAEILMPGGNAGEAGNGGRAGGDVPACLHGLFADALTQELIGVVEVLEELGEEGEAVGGDGLLDAFEDGVVHALRVVGGFQQVRRNSGNDYG